MTKSGQNRSSHVRDISHRSVDRRRKKKKKKKKEIIQMKYTVAVCDCVSIQRGDGGGGREGDL